MMRNGVPSGETEADVLADVRREAYGMRGKSSTEEIEVEDALNSSVSSVTTSGALSSTSNVAQSSSSSSSSSSSASSSSSSSAAIKPKEEWEKWYPMEWLAWVTYGPPTDPTNEHWVNEEVDVGPEVVETRKKHSGRVDQRKKENNITAANSIQNEANSIKTTQIDIQKMELSMAFRDHEWRHIQLQIKYSKTDAAIVSTFCALLFGIFI